jgi:hypothetical protein
MQARKTSRGIAKKAGNDSLLFFLRKKIVAKLSSGAR